MKRLIVLCDGTLEDADAEQDTSLYTNIGRLSRAILEEDKRGSIPVEQIKLYLGGVGTEDGKVVGLVSSAFGSGIMDSVRNIYSFLGLNWESGDEVFLFGFSRGAYTVRLVASLISVIGILHPRRTMHLFPALFEALDNRTGEDPRRDARSASTITKLLSQYAPDKRQQDNEYARKGKFLIKAVGLFDCVATRGRPSTLRRSPDEDSPRFDSFGFDETRLESIIEHAYHALALDEQRIDYVPVLWNSDPLGRPHGQKLQQSWFAGAHADVGGGYREGDLGYLSLWWMAAKVGQLVAIDMDYLRELCNRTVAPYGQMAPHKSRIGEFLLAKSIDRPLPTKTNRNTEEYIHESVRSQSSSNLRRAVQASFRAHELFLPLAPLEHELELHWPKPTKRTRVASEPADLPPPSVSSPLTMPLSSEKPDPTSLSDVEADQTKSRVTTTVSAPSPSRVQSDTESDLAPSGSDDPSDLSPLYYRATADRLRPNDFPPRHRSPFAVVRRDWEDWREKRREKKAVRQALREIEDEKRGS
ncbi:hypothetical protein JCM10212_002990 [Sporobolomyces blumeae]